MTLAKAAKQEIPVSSGPMRTPALLAWESFDWDREPSVAAAKQIYALNDRSTSDFAWAALTLGREGASRYAVDDAERFLADAVGCFTYCGDEYGRMIALAHLASPAMVRYDRDRAMRLIRSPWSSGLPIRGVDARRLHRMACQIHWWFGDPKTGLLHAMQALELADKAGVIAERGQLLGNIAALLFELRKYRLAVAAGKAALAISAAGVSPSYDAVACGNLILSHIFLGDVHGAAEYVALLKRHLTPELPSASSLYSNLCWYAVATDDLESARVYLETQRRTSNLETNLVSRRQLLATEAQVCLLAKEYSRAIELSRQMLDMPKDRVRKMDHILAARCLSGCYAALGKSAESARWKRFAAEQSQTDVMDEIFCSQIEAGLKRDIPNPLTAQELQCLSLSARGQTSADIGMKLGIKPRTVNFHMSKILRKLNALNRQEAIAKAISANFLQR